MANDSKYKTHNPTDLCKGVIVQSNIDSLADLQPGAVISLEVEAKNKVSNAGKHKGSLLYTKYDK